MDDNTPSAAMIAPPGTPGAATMVTPSIMMNPANSPGGVGRPDIYIIATAQATILSVLPARWIVAHSGTVKPAISGRTPLRRAHCRVTGIVAAEDCVPRAVA